MSEQTLDAPPIEVPDGPPNASRRRDGADWRALAYRYRWVLTAAGLLLVSLAIVLYARTRPGYDPYGWLVWGKLTLHLKLDTNGAPSWKPLPYLFTVPYALFGHYALWLWMVTSVAISLSGLIFAWRIAFRLTYSRPERRYASYVAGLFAAAFVLAMQDPVGNYNYTHYILSAESDTMIVSLCLLAVDLHLSGHHKAAFWIWWLGALGRPEVWPFYGLAGVWLWWKQPSYRWWLYGSLFALAFLWFGIPGLTSKSLLTAGNVAENSPREIHGNKITGVITRFHELLPNTVWVLAVLTVAWAAWRRRITILVVAAGVVLWVLIEMAFALHGFPAVPRYMFEAGAVVGILAAVFIGRIVHELPGLLSSLGERVAGARIPARLATAVGTWGTVLAVSPGLGLDASRRPPPGAARARRPAAGKSPDGADRPSARRGHDARRVEHVRVRSAEHPDRLPERVRVVRRDQDRRAVREPGLPQGAPAPAREHLPDRRRGLEGVPEPRGPRPPGRVQQDGADLPRLMRPCAPGARRPVADAWQ